MKSTTLYIIRHGQSMANLKKIVAGHINPQLTEQGIEQAKLLPPYFKDKNIAKIYTSDLDRSVDTVMPIKKAYNIPLVKTEKLREVNCGTWEEVSFTDLPILFPEEYEIFRADRSDFAYTKGESYRGLAERITNAITEIAKENEGKEIIIGSHGDAIKSFIAKNYYTDFKIFNTLNYTPNCSITIVDYTDGKFNFKEIGYVKHLGDNVTTLPNF